MRRDGFRAETLDIEVPFYEWNEGEFELMEELYLNYISNSANIERIKKFIITDYLTQLDNRELAKMFTDFKSKKTIELEERKKQQKIEESQYDDTDSINGDIKTDLEDIKEVFKKYKLITIYNYEEI